MPILDLIWCSQKFFSLQRIGVNVDDDNNNVVDTTIERDAENDGLSTSAHCDLRSYPQRAVMKRCRPSRLRGGGGVDQDVASFYANEIENRLYCYESLGVAQLVHWNETQTIKDDGETVNEDEYDHSILFQRLTKDPPRIVLSEDNYRSFPDSWSRVGTQLPVPAMALSSNLTHQQRSNFYTLAQQWKKMKVERPLQFDNPAYFAPFAIDSLMEGLAEESTAFSNETQPKDNDGDGDDAEDAEKYLQGKLHLRRTATYSLARFLRPNDHDPSTFGNCLQLIPCPCGYCKSHRDNQRYDMEDDDSPTKFTSDDSTTWYLLHPVGVDLDNIRMSRLCIGPTPSSGSDDEDEPSVTHFVPPELHIGDRVQQIQKCGSLTFVARTRLYCEVIKIVMPSSWSSDAITTCQSYRAGDSLSLVQKHRLDYRCLSKRTPDPSFLPLDITSHPRYGTNSWTDSNLALVCRNINRQDECNTIKHIMVGSSGARVSTHIINNLQAISKVQFSRHHPMVIWSAARSFVRPALTGTHTAPKTRTVGYGHSLYSIDLRTSQGTFQWSPSAHDHRIEGVHSLSNVYTDWTQEHCLWASSVSAGKSYELDTRMPCRVVNTWSLPHLCDEIDVRLPPTGILGAGTLFAHSEDESFPYEAGGTSRPMFSVGLRPGTFGIHLYQRPLVKPRLETNSVECPISPGLQFMKGTSIAASGIFPLPDVSGHIFTCGLVALRVPTRQVLGVDGLWQLGYQDQQAASSVCVLSMTNKGDLYSHCLLESTAGYSKSRADSNLPVGASVLNVKDIVFGDTSNDSPSFDLSVLPGQSLPLTRANSLPVESQSDSLELPDLPIRARVKTRQPSVNNAREINDVKPNATAAPTLVVSRKAGQATTDEGVQIRAFLVDKSQGMVGRLARRKKKRSLPQKDPQVSGDCQSDVTPTLLKTAKQMWPRKTYSEDED